MIEKFAVTVGQNENTGLIDQAKEWALQLGINYIEREKGTLDDFLKQHDLTAVVLSTAQGAQAYCQQEKLFYHPSMSFLRIKNILDGKNDRLVAALNLKKGMSVLDCTMGLASDTSVLAYVAGEEGHVTALEASKIIAFIVEEGLKNYKFEDEKLSTVCKNINVINIDAMAYLLQSQDKAFDFVYFDPMFEHSVKGSSALNSLRAFAYKEKITDKVILEAKRVARKRVVIKLPSYADIPDGFQYTDDGKYSKVKYAFIEV